MVQEIAKNWSVWEKRKKPGGSLHSSEEYQVFMRVGRWGALQSFQHEEMTAIISHFKFVAGMNIEAEPARVMWVHPLEDGLVSFACRRWGIIVASESLVIRLFCMMRERIAFLVWSATWVEEEIGWSWALSLCGPWFGKDHSHTCFGARVLCGPASHVHWGSCRDQAGIICYSFSWTTRSAWLLWQPDQTLPYVMAGPSSLGKLR